MESSKISVKVTAKLLFTSFVHIATLRRFGRLHSNKQQSGYGRRKVCSKKRDKVNLKSRPLRNKKVSTEGRPL